MAAPPMLRVVEREVTVNGRLWRGLLFSSFVAPVLFLAAMGFGLGDLVDANTADVDGLRYIEFIAPGLMIASVVQIVAGESLWPVMGGIKWLRVFHGMVASPIRPADVFAGFVLWNVLRSVLMATAFIIVATVFGAIPSAWAVLAIPAAALCGAAFCAPIAAFAATQDSDAAFPLVIRLGIMPLFLFSGTFFPVDQLPERLEPFVWLSPLWHGVELARAATTGDFEGTDVVHVAVLMACVVLGAMWGVRSFTRKLAS